MKVLTKKLTLLKHKSQFLVIFTLQFLNSSFAVVPNLEFQVNRNISLFHLIYFEKAQEPKYKALFDEIESSFDSISADDYDKAEFMTNLAEMDKAKYRHKFMTPTFMELWRKAGEKYDRQFDSEAEVLNDRCAELKTYTNKILSKSGVDFSSVFDFYSSSLKKNTKFKIFVCSTLKNESSFAKAFGENIMLKFNYANKVADTCELLEQICHTLFKTMVLPKALSNFFYEHKSKNAYPAYNLLDDILAHAIAKLWAIENLPKPHDSIITKPKDERVDFLAKRILPTINDYLKRHAKIDKDFVDKYMGLVDKHYPNLYRDFKVTMHSISLIVENGIDYTECAKVVKSQFGTKEIISEPGSYTTVFIGKNLGHPVLRTLQDKLPKKNKDYLFIKLHKGKLFFVYNTDNLNKIKHARDQIQEQPPLSRGITFYLD